MMYNSKFVASIKVNGKILRESQDLVHLPFGTCYSILLKNLNTVSCRAFIFIDGTRVLENFGILIAAGKSIEIERFVRNGNLSTGNKFKFIEKTDEIEEFRGNKIEDGIIRIEFQFEQSTKSTPLFSPFQRPNYWPPYHQPVPMFGPVSPYCQPPSCIANFTASSSAPNAIRAISTSGITVPGENSNQHFYIDTSFRQYEDESHSIVFRMVGQIDNNEILEPILVSDKIQCSTCGKKSKSSARFCDNCGAALLFHDK